MKKSIVFLLIIIFVISHKLFAGPGDTTVVQTFDFNWARPTGLNPKVGKFIFPSFSNKTFEKVFMYYKLKCDPTQSPQCGEWDYLSYCNLFEHTALYDSILNTQPKYKYINFTGNPPDTLLYRNTPSWNYLPSFQSYIVHDNTISLDSTLVGNIVNSTFQPFVNGNPDGRSVFIWKASELLSSGLTAGNITGIKLNINGLSIPKNIGRLIIKIKASGIDSIAIPASLDSFLLVYDKNTQLQSDGWHSFQFNQAFNWDGISNILIDFEYFQENQGLGFATNLNAYLSGVTSTESDYFVSFGLGNILELPISRFQMVDTSVTIMFWQYGSEALPYNGSAFEGISATNARLLNVHLPWGNSNVFWDAGKNPYDRINKAAQVSDFKVKWNHWAFTKNAQTGSMKIYLNGNLWHSGSGKTKLMDTIARFIVGNAITYQNGYYKGSVDDFSLWDKDLSPTSIKYLMYNKLTALNTEYQNLVYAYDFNEGNGNIINNISGFNQDKAKYIGITDWNNYKANRFKNLTPLNYKPVIVFEKGVYQSHIDSVFVLDSIKNLPIMIVVYADSLHPTIPTDTLFKYLPYYRYTYNSNGILTDSILMTANDSLFQKYYYYYGAPFEIINKWELGRFITPYGNGLSLGNGWTWIYDVSDFVHLLKDTVYLEAGNFQELLDLKFVFIEGTPPRDILNIKNVWQGNYNLNTFDAKVIAKTFTINAATEKMLKLRTTITGHGMGSTNNCAEFCANTHKLKANGQFIRQWQIMQPCAMNPLYPQGGTWVYNRAAWCPGMPATMQEFELSSYVINNQISIDYDIDYDPDGNYVTESQLVTYSVPNFLNDAAMVEIIAPSNYEINGRFNPICGKPIVKIKNTGKNTLTNLTIDYAFENGIINSFQWSGSLAFLETAKVSLPPMNLDSYTSSSRFWASVKQPNGQQDEYMFNNKVVTAFDTVPVYTLNEYQMYFRTNHKPSETSWKVEDVNGNVVAQSDSPLSANTWYNKIFNLQNGCYKIKLTDLGEDGLKFWANMPPNGNGTAGQAYFEGNIGSGFLTLYSFQTDFGSEICHSFVVNNTLNIKNEETYSFQISPNPANNIINISMIDYQLKDIEIRLYNLYGEILTSKMINDVKNENVQIEIDNLPKGYYLIQILQNGKILSRNRFVKI